MLNHKNLIIALIALLLLGLGPSAQPEITIVGPTQGHVLYDHAFTAAVAPVVANQMITYTWQSAGQKPITNISDEVDTVTFSWDAVGTYTVSVVASYGTEITASDKCTIAINDATYEEAQISEEAVESSVLYRVKIDPSLYQYIQFMDAGVAASMTWIVDSRSPASNRDYVALVDMQVPLTYTLSLTNSEEKAASMTWIAQRDLPMPTSTDTFGVEWLGTWGEVVTDQTTISVYDSSSVLLALGEATRHEHTITQTEAISWLRDPVVWQDKRGERWEIWISKTDTLNIRTYLPDRVVVMWSDPFLIYSSEMETSMGRSVHVGSKASVPISYTWDFGDGIVSTDQDVVYHYNQTVSYTVAMTVLNDHSELSVPKTTTLLDYRQPLSYRITVVNDSTSTATVLTISYTTPVDLLVTEALIVALPIDTQDNSHFVYYAFSNDGGQEWDKHISTGISLNYDGFYQINLVSVPTRTNNAVTLVDMNNDGSLDALTTNSQQGNHLWLNDGTGHFSGTLVNTGSSWGTSGAWGDWDNDNDLDIAFGNYSQANWIYQNNQGEFKLAWESDDEKNTTSIAWGDYDSDGYLDLAVGNYGQVNQVYRNDGDNLYLVWESTGDDKNTQSIAWGDCDNDGDLDLAVGNYRQVNQIYRNNGSSFEVAWESTDSKKATTGLVMGDLDNDGDIDAFIINGNNQTPEVWLNDGRGNLANTPQVFDPSWSADVALGDIDNDNDIDALVVNPISQFSKIWLNDGKGTFTDSAQSLSNFWGDSVALGDIDNDGDIDALVLNRFYPAIQVWLNDGTGKFTDGAQYNIP